MSAAWKRFEEIVAYILWYEEDEMTVTIDSSKINGVHSRKLMSATGKMFVEIVAGDRSGHLRFAEAIVGNRQEVRRDRGVPSLI